MNSDGNNISWYHGKLHRDQAEELLLNDTNFEDGTFLVRESASAMGDFVLSVLYEKEVIHYQIRKHGDDAFFSIDGQTISHGLETLIEYYQEDNRGLVTMLRNPVIKDAPPHDTRRHGRTNLLHRATKEGNYTVVKELLKCGYRSLEAKNQEGQTAVHLAGRLSKDDILEKLIISGANVNCRDTEGYTPLHYACHRNSVNTVKILVEKGGANVQLRNPKTGWVALHEAASRGHLGCVNTLLSLGAPARPRTIDDQIPSDLARINGHDECERILMEYRSEKSNTNKNEWYHGTLERTKSVELLKLANKNTDGSFLVRYSQNSGYVLTMMYLEQPYHFQINIKDDFYYIDDGPYLDSLEHVIQHYTITADGLPTKLSTPVPPEPSPPLPNSPHPSRLSISSSTLPRSFQRNHSFTRSVGSSISSIYTMSTLPLRSKSQDVVLVDITDDSVHDYANDNNESKDTFVEEKYDDYIPRDNIILKEIIGEGEFGSVYKGILQTREGFEEEVAIKTLRDDLLVTNHEEFLQEAGVMMKLNHRCIVRFIGTCVVPSLLMVQELIPLGSMLTYLLENPQLVSPTYELKIWASQIASGMKYLEEVRFVHRDLAARNILLASKYQAKISDFGLSRMLPNEKEYYRVTQGGRWPIKWYAPESYNYGTFSSASDVWSYGVTLWEMYSYGEQPYGIMKGSEVIDLVEKGGRLVRPSKCSHDVYQIMEQCWAYNARNRPTFSELVRIFSSNPEYMNIQELIQSDLINN